MSRNQHVYKSLKFLQIQACCKPLVQIRQIRSKPTSSQTRTCTKSYKEGTGMSGAPLSTPLLPSAPFPDDSGASAFSCRYQLPSLDFYAALVASCDGNQICIPTLLQPDEICFL